MSCRFARYEVRCFCKVSGGNVAAATRWGIYYAAVDHHVMSCAELPQLSRRIRLPMTMIVDSQSHVLWGEYWGNADRDEVHIFASDDCGRSYEPVRTFPRNSIRHIHSILEDEYDDGYWVLTGDENDESGIGWLSRDFKSFEWLIKGDQQCRAAIAFVFKDRLVYGTDTEKDYNGIYAVDKKSGKKEKLKQICGSCIYASKYGRWHVISTSVETFHKFKTNLATLWVSRNGSDWKQIWQVEKDIWPKKYFQYGSIVLPRVGWNRNTIVFSGQALRGIDNRVCIAEIVEKG